MPGSPYRTTATLAIIAGSALWMYGFAASSFWYASEGPSLLELVRRRLSENAGISLSPGVVEQVTGLAVAALGMLTRVVKGS